MARLRADQRRARSLPRRIQARLRHGLRLQALPARCLPQAALHCRRGGREDGTAEGRAMTAQALPARGLDLARYDAMCRAIADARAINWVLAFRNEAEGWRAAARIAK